MPSQPESRAASCLFVSKTEQEPIRGGREIIEEQAEIVRRIFCEYIAGKGPQRIAADLNRDGIASPTGKRWNDTTIRAIGRSAPAS